MLKTVPVAICGPQGYTGQALIKLIMAHPLLKLNGVFTTQSEQAIYQKQPNLSANHIAVYPIADIAKRAENFNAIFLATPAAISMELVKKLNGFDTIIIDLSGAFRLSPDEYEKWYAQPHTAKEFIDKAVYGLTPWRFNTGFNSNAKLIANPGCYATATLMALLPLVNNNIIKITDIVIDAKSGASGAGKQAVENLLFCELSNNFYPYKITKHQHIPEIKRTLLNYSQQSCDFSFVTHILPIPQGISLAIYTQAQPHLLNEEAIYQAIHSAYQQSYQDYPLLKHAFIDANNPAENQYLLEIKYAVGTPFVHIGYSIDKNKIMIFSCIDNLLKGAVSQAIENINVMLGFPIATGLLN